MTIKIPVEKVAQDKISISFTWDDNSVRHVSIIAPLFIENGFRCTFYIVPGAQEFDSLYAAGYADLHQKGFEIGSHSYTHHYMTSLSEKEVELELSAAIEKILQFTNHYPLTFAFPNHDYNESLLIDARKYHLETRNTLSNSKRFSIKTDTPLKHLIQAIDEAIFGKTNLVFSAHSIVTEEEYFNQSPGEGYQPMRVSILSDLLQYLKTITSKADVITFSQSALREMVIKKGVLKNALWTIDEDSLKVLENFYITQDNIISLL